MAHKYKIKGVLHSAHISNLYCWFSFSWLSFRPVVLPGSPLVNYVKKPLTHPIAFLLDQKTDALFDGKEECLSALSPASL